MLRRIILHPPPTLGLGQLVSTTGLRGSSLPVASSNSSASSASALLCSSLWTRGLRTTGCRNDLMEFFDDKKNWGESTIRVGRSWRKDELRLKSNTDLHKLWYVFLKEKNMLLTMEQAAKDESEFFPNPERIDKVEESMKNLEEVVRERNRAYYMLETGTTGERPGAEEENFLGLPEYKQFTEYTVPKEQNKEFLKAKSEEPVVSPEEKTWFLVHWNEKQLRVKRWERMVARRHVRRLIQQFPNVDRVALREAYPNIDVDKILAEMDEKHLGNVRPRYYFWNRCYKENIRTKQVLE